MSMAGRPTCAAKKLLCCSWVRNLVTVGKGPQERDKSVFLLVRKFKVAQLPFVKVSGVLGRRPARDLLARITCRAFGQNISRIVKVHYLFHAFEVAIVHVGFHKVRPWTHINIAQSGNLELRVELRRALDPLCIRIQLAAVALQRAQEGSDSLVDIRASRRVWTVAALVRLALVVDL